MKTIIRQKKAIMAIAISCLFGMQASGKQLNPQPGVSAAVTLLQQALTQYAEIARNGGWQKIILRKKQYLKGETAVPIQQVKKRLQATGDLIAKDTSSVFTADLVTAVEKHSANSG